ncbi:alpha/beta fold hydrolase [Xenorhabdus sp. KK7.4]|uniref:alpha/beta fold hydrolase n=1 Tax=Xenorhabdus sp. KK7.4 TaxID=1851572 RepID=UPI000C044212|nr:alpha/beta fold hydrolase [Xenorhabdus sp. KK7.4]PHM51299.1 epoxide hydrolase EphB [Xenorhabdus sp. KK7.4]
MFLKSGELILHVDLQGSCDAPVLVLLHSLGTNLHLWDPIVSSLTRYYRVLRLDMRGHGLSEVGQVPFLIKDLAKDILSVADYFGIDMFSVAGVSIGGLIAQNLADRVPERLVSMVLIDTYLAPTTQSIWSTMAYDIRNHGLSHRIQEIFSRWVTPAFRDTPSAIGMKQMLSRTSAEGYAGCVEALSQIKPEQPKNTKIPVLVLVGESDIVATPAAAQEMAIARNGKLVVLKDAAHIPILEKSDEILEEMMKFLVKNFNQTIRMEASV